MFYYHVEETAKRITMRRHLLPCFALLLFVQGWLYGLEIIDKPIVFGTERVALTKQYIKEHYGIDAKNIQINPRMIVIHYTASNDFNRSFSYVENQTLSLARSDIAAASALNVSAHFMVDRDGTVYRLMPETDMARHVIGLNYCSIGIENVGGENGQMNLTTQQLEANVALVRYLKKRYPDIDYVIGHYEYQSFKEHPLWLEKNPHYRTQKTDPGEEFMRALREQLRD